MINQLKDNVTFKFTDNNIVEVFIETSEEGKQIKNITFNDFVESMIAARMQSTGHDVDFYDTPMLTNNIDNGTCTVKIREFSNGVKYVILFRTPYKSDIQYHDTHFSNVGIPGLLFAIKIKDNTVQHVKIVAVKDKMITEDTQLFSYPFSNVNPHDGSVCFGRNKITEINFDSLLSLHSIPYMFQAMPCNDDNYGHNSSGLAHRKLLEELQNKDFNNEWLVSNGKTFNQWFDKLNV